VDPEVGRPRRRRSKIASRPEMSRFERILRGLTGIVLVLAVWEVLHDSGAINASVWSSPREVWSALTTLIQLDLLGPACWQSFKLFFWGFTAAAVSGIAIGVVLGWYRRPRAVLDPWVSMLNAAPRVGMIPIIIAAAGIGMKAQVIVVWSCAIFPIVINVAAGVEATDRDYVRVARSYLATNREVLLKITLPSALPLIVAGLRQGLTAALIGVVIAEYFVGNEGVGGLIIIASGSGRTGQAFVGALIFSVTALIVTSLLRWFERRVSRWR
jgi:ABC-type nitrate/sulfonate/bicarbonate transport system permease component